MMTLALGGFILMEIISNAQRNSAGDVNTLGKVNGEEIQRADFERYQALIYSNADANSSFQVRDQTWKYFVEKKIIQQEAENLGLGVGRDELRDLEFGANISPLIKERYKGEDGQVNMNYLNSVKNAIDAGQLVDQEQYPFRSSWVEQEGEVVKERLEEKIVNMVSKGLYTPTWQAEMVYKENNERLDFAYVRIPYDKVKEEEAPVTDADYKAFLAENPKLYDQKDETRVLSYVVYDVVPTASDTSDARQTVSKLLEGFRSTKSDSLYVTSNNGVWDETYKVKSALPVTIADTLMRLPVGSYVGPYLDGGVWNIAKIMDRKVLPDSVRARHILLKGANPALENTIDSLQNLITTGKVRFDSLAIQNSQDGSALQGGDLGWFASGAMVAEFNNVCFFKAEQGKTYKVKTQFGWHLIEVTGKKFIKNELGVRTVFLSQRVEPSKNTQQAVKDRAVALVQQVKTIDDLIAKTAPENLKVESTKPLVASDYNLDALGTGSDAREIVRWGFEEKSKAGMVSKEIFSFRDATGGYFDSKYVVAALKSIAPAGSASVATLKSMPDADLKVKNHKKGEFLKGKIQTVTDLSALAQQFETKVDTARGAAMMQAGGEPRVVGTVFSLAKDAISSPIIGNGGVYVVKPISDKPQSQAPADLTLFRRQMSSSTAGNVKMNLINSLKKTSNIRDNRSRFF